MIYYFCDIEQCNFKTHSLPNLKSHTKFVHDKVKNFSCNLCDQKFIDKRAVTKHLKTKHGVVRWTLGSSLKHYDI